MEPLSKSGLYTKLSVDMMFILKCRSRMTDQKLDVHLPREYAATIYSLSGIIKHRFASLQDFLARYLLPKDRGSKQAMESDESTEDRHDADQQGVHTRYFMVAARDYSLLTQILIFSLSAIILGGPPYSSLCQ